MPLKTQLQGDIKVKFVILRRNLKPRVLKTLIMLYRLGTSDILWQHLWFYAPSWGGCQTWPLTWRTVVWPCLRQGSEQGFNFTTAAWIQCHSDVVVVAVSPEPDEPPSSKKGHMKTKNLFSGDSTVSSVLSSLPTPSHSLKPFLKAVRLDPSPLETAPTLPWKCLSNQAFPTPKIPFMLEECPSQHIFTAPPGRSAMTASIWHAHQEPSRRQTWWQSVSALHSDTELNTHTAKRQGRDPAVTHTSLFLPLNLCCLPATRLLWTSVWATLQHSQEQRQHSIYRPCPPHLCWTAEHCYLIFVIVFALVMLNKPEASTTAKIDSVYKRIKELTACWESLSIYRKQAPLHDKFLWLMKV